jgi:hypothetical protein
MWNQYVAKRVFAKTPNMFVVAFSKLIFHQESEEKFVGEVKSMVETNKSKSPDAKNEAAQRLLDGYNRFINADTRHDLGIDPGSEFANSKHIVVAILSTLLEVFYNWEGMRKQCVDRVLKFDSISKAWVQRQLTSGCTDRDVEQFIKDNRGQLRDILFSGLNYYRDHPHSDLGQRGSVNPCDSEIIQALIDKVDNEEKLVVAQMKTSMKTATAASVYLPLAPPVSGGAVASSLAPPLVQAGDEAAVVDAAPSAPNAVMKLLAGVIEGATSKLFG